MNGYQRIMTTLKGGVADRTPMMLHNFMPAAQEAGYSMGQYRSDPRKIADAHVRFAETYGMDGILIDIDTCLEASAIGVNIDYPDHEPARAVSCLSTDLDYLYTAMNPEKLVSNERIDIALEAVRLTKEKVGGELAIRGNCDQAGFSLAMLSYGMGDFMADLMDEDLEEGIIRLIDRATDVHLRFHQLMRQAGADITSFGDSSCGPDLISPTMYRQYSRKFHQKIAQACKESGTPVVCHICGNLDLILPDVAACGFAAIEADYKTDIHKASRVLQENNTVMFGPIDPSGVFFFAKPEAVAAETQRILEIFGGKRLVIGAGCALPSGTPKENIEAFVRTVQNYEIG